MSNRKKKTKIEIQVGQRIRQARKEAGYSQKDLAKALKLSDKAVSSYEVGRAQPNLETLQAISKATFKSVSYFLDEADPEDLDLQLRIKRIEQELLRVKKALRGRG